MAAINNQQTTDTYIDATTLDTPATSSLTVQVSNATVYYQLNLNYPGTRPSASNWIGEERILQPGFWSFSAADFNGATCYGIRFRSGVSGVPAIVTASN